MEGLLRLHILYQSIYKHGRHRQFLFLTGRFFKSSFLKPLSQMNRNLVGSIYGRSSIAIAHFVLIRLQTWPPRAIRVSDWLISTRKIPLKPPSQMNHKLVGSIYGMSSITIAHFILIRWQTWPPQAILVSDWFISKISSPLKQLIAKWTVTWQ